MILPWTFLFRPLYVNSSLCARYISGRKKLLKLKNVKTEMYTKGGHFLGTKKVLKCFFFAFHIVNCLMYVCGMESKIEIFDYVWNDKESFGNDKIRWKSFVKHGYWSSIDGIWSSGHCCGLDFRPKMANWQYTGWGGGQKNRNFDYVWNDKESFENDWIRWKSFMGRTSGANIT